MEQSKIIDTLETYHTCPYKLLVFLEEVEEWSGNNPKILDELAIIASEDEESAHLFNASGGWPLLNCQHFVGISRNSVLVDDMAEVGDLFLGK